MSSATGSSWSIRPAVASDLSSISRICILTSNAGESAESYEYPELLSFLYAEPYLALPRCFTFVLVHAEPDGTEEILGYIVGTLDTRHFESAIQKDWCPPIRHRYPKHLYTQCLTAMGRQLIASLYKFKATPQEIIDVSEAHVHISLLPQAQRQGWGKKLIGEGVGWLKERGSESLFVRTSKVDLLKHNTE